MATRGVDPNESRGGYDRTIAPDEIDSRRDTAVATGGNTRGVDPNDPYDRYGSSSSGGSSKASQGRVVDGRYVYDDAGGYAGGSNTVVKPTAQPTQAAQPKSTVTAGAKGTVNSPTISTSNPYGGNVTDYSGMTDEELMLLYTNGIDSNNWLGYDLDPLRYELRRRGMTQAADNINAYRNKKIEANNLGYDHEYWNEETQRYEPRKLKPFSIKPGTPGGAPTDAYSWLYNDAQIFGDAMNKTIEDYYKNQTDQARAEYEYAIWKGQQELLNALNNGKSRYNQAVAQNAISSLQAADNLALRNAAAGDLGGIGGKLYSDQQASFDAQLGDIRNEELRLYNETEQQAALLEAQDRFEEAQAVREVGAQRLQALLNLQDELWNNGREDYKWVLNYGMNYQQQALDNALTRLQLGILSDSDIEALGVAPEEAKNLANYYNQIRDIDMQSAMLQLQQQAANLGVTQQKLAGTYGTSSGSSGGGSSGGGSSYYASKIAAAGDDAMALYSALLGAGAIDKGSALSWLLKAGYKDTNANRLAEAYADWYAGQNATTKYNAWQYREALYNQGYFNRADIDDAQLYLKKALGFSDEEAQLYADSYFTWLEGQLAEMQTAQRLANSPNPYALALTAGDASMDNVGAGTDGLYSGEGALGFSSIPMTNEHTETTLYIEGRPYTQSQFATLLKSGQIRDIGTNAMHHFINAASPEWSQTQPWAERTPIQEVIPYNSVLELTDAYMAGDISEADYTYWLSRFNSSYGNNRPTTTTSAPAVDMDAYLANSTAAGAYQSALEALNKGNPYTLPDSYWKTYGQER